MIKKSIYGLIGVVACWGLSCNTAEGVVVAEHQSITSYDGQSTCIACHENEAQDMLNSLHMQWSGPTRI